MIIDVQQLGAEGAWYAGTEPAQLLEMEPGATVRPDGPVAFDVMAQLAGLELVVQGTLRVPLACRCNRCTEMFSTSLTISDFLCARELSTGQERVDLADDVREEVLLRLPHYPLCLPACRGLCPQCGQNLNRGPCRCAASPAEGLWAALQGLTLPTPAGRKTGDQHGRSQKEKIEKPGAHAQGAFETADSGK